MSKKGKLLLADVASILYAAGYVGSRQKQIKDIIKRGLPKDEEDNLIQAQIVLSNDFNRYTKELDDRLEGMFKYSGCTHFILFGDKSVNFRKLEFPTYKADRVKEHRKFSTELTKYCEDKYHLIRSSIFESDDMLTFLNKHFQEEGWEVILGAIDSDMKQVPNANLFNFGYKNLGFTKVSKNQADFTLYRNILLAGHNNEISLTGCGEKTAAAYLRQFKTPSQYKYGVLKAYIEGIKKVPRDSKIKDVKDDLLYIYKDVKGYGLSKGFKYFGQAFRESYLIREMYEVQEILDLHAPGTTFDIPIPIEIREEVDEVDGIEDTEIVFD